MVPHVLQGISTNVRLFRFSRQTAEQNLTYRPLALVT